MFRYKFWIIFKFYFKFLFYSNEGNKNEDKKVLWLEHRYTTDEQNKENMFEKNMT